MRVLIIRNAYQHDTGGAEQYSFNQALALKSAGHTGIVVTKHAAIREKCRKENIQTINGIWHESQEWGRHYYIRRILMTLWYAWIIFRHRIDVVNPESRDDFIFATGGAQIMRKPSVWSDHADLKYIMDRVNHPHPRMQSWILSSAEKARAIIVSSVSEQKEILAVVPELESKLVLIHNGVFRPKNVKPVKKKKFVIGTNSRLVASKGINEFLEAFAKIHPEHPDFELWVLGGHSNNEEHFLKKAEDLGIKNSVRFLGYKPNPNDYVASMDIFVHPSYHEAFSLAVIEGCMLGRPIIATETGGTPEIINEKTGILIRSKNVPDLVKALNKLIDYPELRKKLGNNARQRAYEEFDFEKIVADKIVPLYRKQLS